MGTKQLVNPIAISRSSLLYLDSTIPILDISFLRVVVENAAVFSEVKEGDFIGVHFLLEPFRFLAQVQLKTRSDEWLRFSFDKVVPSSRAFLRSFLNPKRVGESIIEDWRTDRVRHYHGLNDSELWFDDKGALLFTYLDSENSEYQFLFRITDVKSLPQVGKMLRRDYVELSRLESDLPMLSLPDRESFDRLSECRDIITNFRPVGQLEYHLKQRLLKVVSQTLYSTGKRVEVSSVRRITPSPQS